MNFGVQTRPRGNQDRSIVPMINVVFLLLIFFLMTASLTPPAPFEITPPEAEADPAEPRAGTLYISADGAMALGTVRGQAVFEALAADPPDGPLPIQADAAYPAAELATLLPNLAEVGITGILIVTVHP